MAIISRNYSLYLLQ